MSPPVYVCAPFGTHWPVLGPGPAGSLDIQPAGLPLGLAQSSSGLPPYGFRIAKIHVTALSLQEVLMGCPWGPAS